MEMTAYDLWRRETAKYPGQSSFQGLIYCSLALAGETGETANKVKKIWRDKGNASVIVSETQRFDLLQELGDALWYIASAAEELDSSLAEVAEININKLRARFGDKKGG